ncbi:DUF4041 domain-containing protein [Kushneria sp. EE4]
MSNTTILLLATGLILSGWIAALFFARQSKLKQEELNNIKKSVEHLWQYENIHNASERADEINILTEEKINQATLRAIKIQADAEHEKHLILDNSRTQAQEIQKKAEAALVQADEQAHDIIVDAHQQAQDIAGNALKAAENAELYKKTAQAMRNIIEGYHDEYIVPNASLLDDLAEDFSYKEAGEKLKQARKNSNELSKSSLAGDCDYVEKSRRAFAIHFAVDAFNGKVDSILSKVKHDNYGKLHQGIIDAFHLVNHNGLPFKNARITDLYLQARLEELKWAVATMELRKQEQEEQREIREQMREEEKARKEMEKAIKQAEKEERMLAQAMEEARRELDSANEEVKLLLQTRLAELEQQLEEAGSRGQRAISMAQQTKRGHVYVISNIGSLGENVFKIGMTRRLEPLDRVRELSDASVPFPFDVHAMIYSDDAPSLERELHRRFADHQVNRINPRKEFFKISLSEVREAIKKENAEVHWTIAAEAWEYHESQAIAQKKLQAVS